MSLIRKHGAVLQAWACLDLVFYCELISIILTSSSQRRRGSKSRRAKSCNFPTDTCKFPTEDIMGARNFDFPLNSC